MKKEEVENINELKVPKGTKYEKCHIRNLRRHIKTLRVKVNLAKLFQGSTLDKETGGTVSDLLSLC